LIEVNKYQYLSVIELNPISKLGINLKQDIFFI